MSFDFKNFSPPRAWNWALIAPPGRSIPGADSVAPLFSADICNLRRAVLLVASAEPKIALLAEEGDCLQFRSRSRIFGFPDLIDVQLLELAPGRVSLAIFSRARYGLYDLGVNRRRVKNWIRAIATYLVEVGTK